MVEVRRLEPAQRRRAVAEEILRALPEWFGLEDSLREYVRNCGELPVFAAFRDGQALGFAALRRTAPKAAEIYVMGVRKESQGQGVGRALFQALRAEAVGMGCAFLQVKTVREGCYEVYDRTNRFYRAMGFVELECFPTLWDEHNPFQLYVMAL